MKALVFRLSQQALNNIDGLGRREVEIVRGTVVTGIPSLVVISSEGSCERWRLIEAQDRLLCEVMTSTVDREPERSPQRAAAEW